jgi:IS1 family transposase
MVKKTDIRLNEFIKAKQTVKEFGMMELCRFEKMVQPLTRQNTYGPQGMLFSCKVCEGRFSSNRNTAYFGLKTDREIVTYVAKALAEGMGIRAASRVFGIDADTVLRILCAVGSHCRKVNAHFLHDLEVRECQLDEMWTIVESKAMIEDEEGNEKRNIGGDRWIWIAFDVDSKLVLAHHVGSRTIMDAMELFNKLQNVTSGIPALFTSDDLADYSAALLKTYGVWHYPPRTGRKGRPRNPILLPPPELRYAQVNKKFEKNKVAGSRAKVVYGNKEDILAELSELSCTINTSYIERRNLTFRQDNRRLARKTISFSKTQYMLEYQLDLSIAYSHFVRPHMSLRCKDASGKAQDVTPCMAKGLTDKCWTMEELLSFDISTDHIIFNKALT